MKIPIMVLASSNCRERVIQTLPHVLGHRKNGHLLAEGKVLIRAYVGKPGDTVVDDHTDNELVSDYCAL